MTVTKLITGWIAVSALAILAGLLWLRGDWEPGHAGGAIEKLSVLISLTAGCGFLFTHVLGKRWSRRAGRLERFAAALPTTIGDLPEDGPPELSSLSRAMKRMAEQVRHVVERARVEASRRETVLAGMAEGVIAVDENLKLIFCNDAFAQAFSTRVPVTEGRPLYEVVREPALRDFLQAVVRTGKAEKSHFRPPSAAGRWFEAHCLPLGEGPHRGAIAVLHDITDIQRQVQARKDFVANVSHELRTPLAAIRGYAETLLDGALEDETNNRKFVEVILSHAIRLNNIASDLLILSELDSNVQAGSQERVSVLSVIDSALHTVQSSAETRAVKLIRGEWQDCSVLGYRVRLEQVMVNLLDNAVKFNRQGGEVHVHCSPVKEGFVRISVSDTGMGIPSEDLGRIFERFYRVDKARQRSPGGTGLGLSIVKDVVERMGGTVSVESQLGKGTSFSLVLKGCSASH